MKTYKRCIMNEKWHDGWKVGEKNCTMDEILEKMVTQWMKIKHEWWKYEKDQVTYSFIKQLLKNLRPYNFLECVMEILRKMWSLISFLPWKLGSIKFLLFFWNSIDNLIGEVVPSCTKKASQKPLKKCSLEKEDST